MIMFKSSRGKALPLGATHTEDGANFALFCRHGTKVNLVLFNESASGEYETIGEIELDSHKNKTGDHWHIRLYDLPDEFCYGWKVDGPIGKKHRYNAKAILLDPYSRMLSGGAKWGSKQKQNGKKKIRLSQFTRTPSFDWGEDAPPLIKLEDTIIYELHVRGFTCDASSGVKYPGTFAGLTEKIPYLIWLGITAVELLPIHEFNENDCQFTNPETGEKLKNFWGYNTISFGALKAAFAASSETLGQIDEFRDMVKAFHEAGIEVFLDVVFNHTGEGDDKGETYSFRGLDNSIYYILDENGQYLNYTGCGNTVNCNHLIVQSMLIDSLRYWCGSMHIDGFRFDLASILGRDSDGNVLSKPPSIEKISEDGILANTKLIAEPWDAAGLYQVGTFPFGKRWTEWNGKYRDDVRRFWKGDHGMAGALATRFCGSMDLYFTDGRSPLHSINFVTCHDGFTLYDLVSYNQKHNFANGEQNRDGSNDNHSWNSGIEGETAKPEIIKLRLRRAKNMMATLLLSQGVPMILAGDEFLRTQLGNNNAWCQDNQISWVDWTLEKKQTDFLRFTRELIWLRRNHPALRRKVFFTDQNKEITWHGLMPDQPNFQSRSLAFVIDGSRNDRKSNDCDWYVACHASDEAAEFHIPKSPSGRPWRKTIDTNADSPADFFKPGSGPFAGKVETLQPHSMIVLTA